MVVIVVGRVFIFGYVEYVEMLCVVGVEVVEFDLFSEILFEGMDVVVLFGGFFE